VINSKRPWGRIAPNRESTSAIGVLAKLGSESIETVSGQGCRFAPEVIAYETPSGGGVAIAKHNFPHLLTNFVGREQQIARGTRMVLLHGFIKKT
jgi:hypothetical protein